MKKVFFFLLLFLAATPVFSQSEGGSTQKAEFPGGEKAFLAEFHKMVNGYIDLYQYGVNGTFHFTFDIDVDGKIKNLKISPKVKNSDMFIDDMMFAMKKIKKPWKPALQDGKPVLSKYTLKVTFTTDHFDHDD